MLGPLHRDECGNASLQWSGPRGTSAGGEGVLPMLCHLRCSAKSWGAQWWGVLVFPQHGTMLRQTTHQMARALAAERLGWIQHVVMEQKSGSDFTGKAAARNRSLLRQVGSSEGVKWQMTDGGHVAQGASYFELRSCSKAFREINIFLSLMTAIYYIVLSLFFFFFNWKHPPNLSICAQAFSLKAGDEDEHHLCSHCPSQADWVMMMFLLALYLYNLWQ